MNKLLTLLFLILATYSLQAQRVPHTHYVTYYNPLIKGPDSVVWDLTPQMVGCEAIGRTNPFKADPQIEDGAKKSDYLNSGYDKGHLFSFADAECASQWEECFFMSNMLPQIHAFNEGDWGTLEIYERSLAANSSIHIIAGGIGTLGILPAGENIPAQMWKAIYSNGQWTCWIMENKVTSKKHGVAFWMVDITTFDARTGLHLHN